MAIRRGSEWKKGKGVKSGRVMLIERGKGSLKENLSFQRFPFPPLPAISIEREKKRSQDKKSKA